jgi:hypothetical protein
VALTWTPNATVDELVPADTTSDTDDDFVQIEWRQTAVPTGINSDIQRYAISVLIKDVRVLTVSRRHDAAILTIRLRDSDEAVTPLWFYNDAPMGVRNHVAMPGADSVDALLAVVANHVLLWPSPSHSGSFLIQPTLDEMARERQAAALPWSGLLPRMLNMNEGDVDETRWQVMERFSRVTQFFRDNVGTF